MNNELPLLPHQASMTQLVLPNDTNQLGNLLGGQLMHWIDLVAAIARVVSDDKEDVVEGEADAGPDEQIELSAGE